MHFHIILYFLRKGVKYANFSNMLIRYSCHCSLTAYNTVLYHNITSLALKSILQVILEIISLVRREKIKNYANLCKLHLVSMVWVQCDCHKWICRVFFILHAKLQVSTSSQSWIGTWYHAMEHFSEVHFSSTHLRLVKKGLCS